jgi:MSHA biogenesis protein MshI
MRLPTFFRSFARRAAPSGRLGLVATDESASAAFVHRTAGAKPRVALCRAAVGPHAVKTLAEWRAHQGLADVPANLLLPVGDYQILPVDVADLPPDELADAARWKVKDMIDYPPEQASVACVLVPSADLSSPARQGLAVVAPRETVAQRMQRMLEARHALDAIDIPELALRNVALLVPGPAAVGLLHVGLARTTLVMVWQGELCTFRRFELTAQQLIDALPEQREALIERLGLDLQRTCDAFERQFYSAALGPLRVIDEVPGLSVAALLRPFLNTPVEPLALREWLDIDSPDPLLDPAQGLDFIPAIGAALRDEPLPASPA